jgi:hypothetical protein
MVSRLEFSYLQIDLTPQQRKKLERLQSAARYIPKSLAHEILGFSARRWEEIEAEAYKCSLGILFIGVLCLLCYGAAYLVCWVTTKWKQR